MQHSVATRESWIDRLSPRGRAGNWSFGRFVAYIELVARVRRERRALSGLDERMLKDLGLDAADVSHETSRDLFDLPPSRWS